MWRFEWAKFVQSLLPCSWSLGFRREPGRKKASVFNKQFQCCRVQVLLSFWKLAGTFEVPCVQG